MSIKTISGEYSQTNCTVSRPSPASATTSIPDIRSRSERIPARTILWSSASRTRIGAMELIPPVQWKTGEHQRAGVEGRIDFDDTANCARAFTHSAQAERRVRQPVRRDPRYVKADAVVSN